MAVRLVCIGPDARGSAGTTPLANGRLFNDVADSAIGFDRFFVGTHAELPS